MNEEDLLIYFVGMALAGASNNIQQQPEALAKRCVQIGVATQKEFIKAGLLTGVKPRLSIAEVMQIRNANGDSPVPQSPQPSIPQPAPTPTVIKPVQKPPAEIDDYIESMRREAAAQGVQGIPTNVKPPTPGGS